jgi:hypothetical protein
VLATVDLQHSSLGQGTMSLLAKGVQNPGNVHLGTQGAPTQTWPEIIFRMHARIQKQSALTGHANAVHNAHAAHVCDDDGDKQTENKHCCRAESNRIEAIAVCACHG